MFEKFSDQWYLALYLQYGSVEEVFKRFKYALPISIPHYHRLVRKYGIVKSCGRRKVNLTEVIHFFLKKALEPTLGIETLYYQMPPNFQTSLASLHRIYRRVMERTPGRFATALIIHPKDEWSKVLMGQEVRTQRMSGKFRGNWSLPMTFSQQGEPGTQSILRVLQQEVATNQAITGKLGLNFISPNLKPFSYCDILDVRVSIYELDLPDFLSINECTSYKLSNHSWQGCGVKLPRSETLRMGMKDILDHYLEQKTGLVSTHFIESELNRQLLSPVL